MYHQPNNWTITYYAIVLNWTKIFQVLILGNQSWIFSNAVVGSEENPCMDTLKFSPNDRKELNIEVKWIWWSALMDNYVYFLSWTLN